MIKYLKRLNLNLLLPKSSRVQNFLIFLLLAMWSFWVYRHGIISSPRSDHFPFMEERGYFHSDWDYFRNIFTYTRNRHVMHDLLKEDAFISRPGMLGMTALLDIFFRENLFILGAVSILLHALSGFSLFLITSKLVNRAVGFLLSFSFLAQYSGMEMVFWRHINPLALGVTFFGIGLSLLYGLNDAAKQKSLIVLIVLNFLLSSLFHETMLVVLLAGSLFFFFMKEHKTGTGLSKRNLVIICLAPLVINLCLNAYGMLHYNQGFVEPKGENVIHWPSFMHSSFLFLGAVLTAFAIPELVHVRFADIADRVSDRGIWNFSDVSNHFFYLAGAFFLVWCCVILMKGMFDYNKGRNVKVSAITILGVFYLSALVGALIVVRIKSRSISYLYGATYYYYMTNYLLTFLAALSIDHARDYLSNKNVYYKISALSVLFLFLGIQTACSYEQIQTLLRGRMKFDQMTARYTGQIAKSIQHNPAYCYGGRATSELTDYVLPILLFRESCLEKKGIPLYVAKKSDESFWLSKLNPEFRKSAAPRYGYLSEGSLVFSENPNVKPMIGSGSFLLSRESFEPTLFQAHFHHGFIGGLVIRFQDLNNFIILIAHDFYFYVMVNQNGSHSPPLFVAPLVFDKDEFEFTLRKVGDDYFIFYNQMLISKLEGIRSMRGGVGLYDKGSAGGTHLFSKVVISESAVIVSKEQIYEPVLPLDFSH